MDKEKANYLIIGCVLIIMTKIFDASNFFLFIGLILIFDALFSTKNNENEIDE